MAGKEITVVGGGLAGLTAAINLARSGREVLVLDKEQRHGGRPEFRPDGAASPFDLEKVKAFTGIDISDACHHVEHMVMRIFGRRLDLPHREGSQTYMVERGPRSTSIDTLLYNQALEAGVKFEWGFTIKSPADVGELPEGSIISTGLDVQGFEAMGIPYVPFWGWFAKSLVDDQRTLAWAYIDDFTVDYAFTTQVNGSLFALLFQRERPLSRQAKRKFEDFTAAEGLELTGWRDLVGGAAPHRCMSNPILYKNNMIVLGTLAGVMEPMLNFGMLGALVCGKIGAIAVEDRAAAYDEFRKLTSFYRRSLLVKRVNDRMPPALRRAFWGGASNVIAGTSVEMQNKAMRFVPGYGGFPG